MRIIAWIYIYFKGYRVSSIHSYACTIICYCITWLWHNLQEPSHTRSIEHIHSFARADFATSQRQHCRGRNVILIHVDNFPSFSVPPYSTQVNKTFYPLTCMWSCVRLRLCEKLLKYLFDEISACNSVGGCSLKNDDVDLKTVCLFSLFQNIFSRRFFARFISYTSNKC